MQSEEARKRADQFFALHGAARPLVLLHAWDAGSASVLADAGAPAIATTSTGMAWSLGHAKDRRVDTSQFLATCERICRAVTVPVSVEMPSWFSTNVETCAVVRELIALG